MPSFIINLPSRRQSLNLENCKNNERNGHEKPKENELKKRISISSNLDEPCIKGIFPHHVQENVTSFTFPQTISFEECSGTDDVVITPTYMEFQDPTEGLALEQTLLIQNRGKKMALIKIREPNSMAFDIKPTVEQGFKLCPGLNLSRAVRYFFRRPISVHAMIPIEINGTELDYHLICTKSAPAIAVSPTKIDFGCVDIGSVSDIKRLVVKSVGGKSARFCIDVGKNEMKINVQPMKGLVKLNEEIALGVQVTGRKEGIFCGEFWIKSFPNIPILIKVHIIKPRIILSHPPTLNGFTFLKFPPIFWGTQWYFDLPLKNYSSETSSFVAFFEVNNDLISIQESDAKENSDFDVFRVHPVEGRLQPFQEITLSVTFAPTLKNLNLLQNQQHNKSIEYFIAIIKVKKIQAAEARSILKYKKTKSNNVESHLPEIYINETLYEKDTIDDALSSQEQKHSDVETIYLHGDVEIARLHFEPNQIYLGDLGIDDKILRVISVKNLSKQLPLTFSFVSKSCVKCEPRQVSLQPDQSVEVLITITAQLNLDSSFLLEFDLWADSKITASNKVRSIKIDRASVYCTYNPLKAAGKIKTTTTCKTVSLNKLPLEPDYSLTYTSSEFEMKMNHREFWTQYFRSIFSHNAKGIDANKTICGCRYFEKTCCSIRMLKTNDTIVQKSFKRFPKLKILENPSIVTSLSPFQIYKIQISPVKLDFGKVAVKIPNHSELTFENKNDFRVEIILISLNEKNVSFPGGNRIFLQPESTKTYAVEFRSSHYGKYSSYINYTINNCLRYQLPIAAEVVTKSLELKTKEITFDNDYHPQEGYRIPFQVIEIQNKIKANTKFKWTLSTRTGFTIDPPIGIVAAARRLCICVYPTALPQHAEATMIVENGARAILKLETPRQQRAPRVSLLEANMDVGEVPLCLTHRLHAILNNAEYYEVVFEVDDDDLLRGVDVTPLTGHVPPRGVVVLNITLKFDTCMKFSTLINIVVQKRITLQLKLSGTVVFPRLKFEPSIIEMKKISSNSYQIKEILITNLTNAKIIIQVLLKQYPEFCLSFSASRNDYINDEVIIQILPQTTLKLFLHVTPCDLAVYSFYIPLIINEMLGPVSIESDNISPNNFMKRHSHFYSANTGITKLPIPSKIPTIYVHCTITHPIICFNKLSFKFNDDLQEDEIRIINNSRKEVSITLITEDVRKAKDCPFIICWMQGGESILVNNVISCLLLPDENALFKVKFQPKKPGHYIFDVPINLGYNRDAQLYNKFKFDGLYATQCIETDVLEVYLVPVPLNVSAKEKFTLKVCDFTKVDSIQAKVCHPEKYSGIFQDDTLKVHFPEGISIDSSSMQHEIVVEIELISAVSVSFCTNIIFSDVEKITSLTVTVYGTVDSSLLTIHIYDQKINSNFILMKHQKYLSDLITFIQPYENLQTLVFDSKSCSISSVSEISKPEREFRLHSMDSCKTVITYKKENASIGETLFDLSYESIKPCKLFYPLFPMSKSSNKQVLYMQKTLKSIEEWLYCNLFHYQFHPNLNEGAIETSLGTKVFQSPSDANKQENNLKLYSLIDIVEYLSEANEVLEINSRLKNTKYKSNHERIQNTLHAYRKIFQYLMLKGACISYVLPEFFLTYNDFEKLRININYFLPECIFKSHSIYSWLDIVLQSYKCFILNPIDEEMLKMQAVLLNNAKNVDNATYKISGLKVDDVMNQSKKHINIPMCEAILLGWLEYYCNQIFDNRSINNFEDCLSDGLALIAVTIAYCPFLKNDFFSDVYLNPVSLEEKTHNGICLISAWKKIRLGFIITPAEIVDPHCVQMLLLIVHLFKNLPTYLLRDKILFSCALTKSITQQIQLSSTPSTPVNYVVQFFGNNIHLFSSKPIISTNPSKKQQIRISYHARKIRKEKVYLVLCGSAVGPHFGENQTFLLEGFPDDLEVSGKYTIRSKLYNPTEKNLDIVVPYNYQTQYEIWLSNNQPKLLDKLIITQWKNIQNMKVLKRLWLNEKVLNVVENSQTVNLSINIACMVCDSRSFWVVFQSDVGDFIIQINSICQTSVTDYASIEVLNKECICTNLPAQFLTECPLSKKLMISPRNHQLDNCILHVFKKSLNKEEKVFWDTCIDNIIGLRFIEWFTRDAKNSIIEECKHLFNPFVIYNISTNNDKLLITPLNIHVNGGQHFNDKFELTMHLSQISPDLTDLLITLASSDKKEIRVCKIEIFHEKSISNSSQQLLKADNKSQSSFEKLKKL